MTEATATEVRSRYRVPAEMLAGLALLLALATAMDMGTAARTGAVGVYLAMAMLVLQGLPRPAAGLGWANRATLLRGVLICCLAGHLAAPPAAVSEQWLIAGLVLTALALDGLDGWLARRTGTVSEFGARFDMELDAFLILVLCLWLVVTGEIGAWVLALGGMRYAFVLVGLRWRYLAAPLPESRRRKAICVWQVAALLVAMAPIVDEITRAGAVASALAALTVSFAVDVRWLYRQHANR